MALQPRLAAPAQLAPIPLPNRGVSPIADAAEVLAQTATAIDQADRQTDLQVDAMNHALAMKQQDEADRQLLLQRSAEWAKVQGRIESRIDQERSTADVGAAGHTSRVQQILKEELDEFGGGFDGNERVRQRFSEGMASTAARYETRETLWQSDMFAKAQGEAGENYAKTVSNSLSLKPDLLAAEDAMAHWRDVVVANMPVNDDEKAKLLRAGYQQIFGAQLDGMIGAGQFEDVDKLVRSGALNAVFDDIEPILRKVEVERREAAALAEEQASQARADAREKGKLLIASINAGEVLTQADVNAVVAGMRAAGVEESEIVPFLGLGSDIAVNKSYSKDVDPSGVKAAAAAALLRPKVEAGKASAEEERRYTRLTGIAEERAKDQGAALKAVIADGPNGQMQALGQLNSLPPGQRYVAAKEAGGKQGEWLGRVAQLAPKTQQFAVDGRAIRTDRPNDFGDAKTVRTAYQKHLGPALAADLGGAYAEQMDIAWDIYAASTASRGEAGWDEAKFQTAVRIAFGATVNKQGNLQGGVAKVNGRMMILPDNYTAPDMERMLARSDFTGAYYADGRPAAKADILAHYRPVWIGYAPSGAPNYKFVDAAGNPLVSKSGVIATKAFR